MNVRLHTKQASVKAPMTAERLAIHIEILNRAFADLKNLSEVTDRLSLSMDLESCDIDLSKLLGFPHFDFAHDIYGIVRHMDRSSYPGKLTNCFVPRSTQQ